MDSFLSGNVSSKFIFKTHQRESVRVVETRSMLVNALNIFRTFPSCAAIRTATGALAGLNG